MIPEQNFTVGDVKVCVKNNEVQLWQMGDNITMDLQDLLLLAQKASDAQIINEEAERGVYIGWTDSGAIAVHQELM